jgi:gamma-aminobutyric acid receptor subunit alpha
MDLHKFPLDSQVCPLHIGSFGYSAEDIIYKWAKPNAVSIDEVGMAQFLLKEYRSFETIAVSNRRTK